MHDKMISKEILFTAIIYIYVLWGYCSSNMVFRDLMQDDDEWFKK